MFQSVSIILVFFNFKTNFLRCTVNVLKYFLLLKAAFWPITHLIFIKKIIMIKELNKKFTLSSISKIKFAIFTILIKSKWEFTPSWSNFLWLTLFSMINLIKKFYELVIKKIQKIYKKLNGRIFLWQIYIYHIYRSGQKSLPILS